MSDPATRTLKISAPSKPIQMDLLKVGEANAQLSEEQAEQLKAARRVAASRLQLDEIPDGASLPEKPIEELESVEVQLPNGRVVEYGPRGNVSARLRVAQIMGQSNSAIMFGTLLTLVNIRSIDGQQIKPIANLVDAQAVANAIGDSGLEVLERVHIECWPTGSAETLPILKKNQRGPGI